MYKIFVNRLPVFLTHSEEHNDHDLRDSDVLIQAPVGKRELKTAVNELLQPHAYRHAIFLSDNPENMLARIRKLFVPLIAAGGLVLNEHNELLMIFRRGKWDLPKGKLDDGEGKRRAALREVKEETGVKKLRLGQPVRFYDSHQRCSYHTYENKGQQILKATYWYTMRGKSKDALAPQHDEGIMEVEWVPRVDVAERLSNSYLLLHDVVEHGLKLALQS